VPSASASKSGLCGNRETKGGEESKELVWREIGVQIDRSTEKTKKRRSLNCSLGSNSSREQ